MTLPGKIYANLGALGLLAVATCAVGGWIQHRLSDDLREAVEKTAVKLDLSQALRARTWEMMAHMRQAYILASLKDRAGVESAAKQWKATRERVDQQFVEIRPALEGDPSATLVERMAEAVRGYDGVAQAYLEACRNGSLDRVEALATQINAFSDVMNRNGLDLRSRQRDRLKASVERADRLRTQAFILTAMVVVLLVVTGVVSVVAVTGCKRTLVATVERLTDGARQVGLAASQISTASASLANAASEQAASLEETSAATHEIEQTTQGNVDAAANTFRRSSATVEDIERSNAALVESERAMDAIVANAGKISNIIKVIDEIAFQTNILALNAAVEAARAGEAGLGFAVVAGEVRSLAQRAAQAAGETTHLVEASVTSIREGKQKLDHMAATITKVGGEVREMKTLAEGVNSSSEQQLRGVREIGSAISQMEQVTQQVAASAEEGAASATELKSQVDVLNDVVGGMSRMVGI
jgi:methyl-accepting chemotaxis protein/methyl-accepting chemotaxis protein-1 (serine sensor receptor)